MRGCLLNKGLLAALHLLGAVRLCQPVMWEKQFFSGQGGPQPRFGHGAFTLDFPSGVLYVYGGLVVDAANGRGAQTANDVWMFDTGGQSWEKAAQEIEGEGPKARAFFSMVGIGQRGLVCGGSQSSVELGPSSSGMQRSGSLEKAVSFFQPAAAGRCAPFRASRPRCPLDRATFLFR